MNFIIGLGGNLGEVRAAFEGAVQAFGDRKGLRIVQCSSLYRTQPVGPGQPTFLNAAVMIDIDCPPRVLLELCHEIEAAAGRDRAKEERWGPRTLDCDVLISDRLVCRGPVLEVPHPRLSERAFALIPAAELAPAWLHPIEGRTLADLADRADSRHPNAVERVEEW